MTTQAAALPQFGRGLLREPAPEPMPSPMTLLGVLLLGIAPALALAIVFARAGRASPWVLPLAGATLLINVGIILMDIRYGLAMFLVAASLSPRLPGAYDNLRVEDFVFALVFVIWLQRSLSSGGLKMIKSPMLAPFVLLTLFSILSTFWGTAMGYVPDVKYGIFLQAKRVEYFLIFWVVATTVRSEGWLRLLTLVFVCSGALAAVYGLMNQESAHGQSVAENRVFGPEGENYNTLCGYLIICIGAGLAAVPGFKGIYRWIMLACIALAGAALLLSFSREGYIMLTGAVGVFAFTRYRVTVIVVAVLLVCVGLAFPPVRQNLSNAINQVRNARDDDPGSNSMTARLRTWEYRFNTRFFQQPMIGCGVGSTWLSVDSEYVLRLCEVGIVGFIFFLWWLYSIGQQVFAVWKARGLPQLLGIGLASAFVGMLIQGIVATSFNTIRTMEPFWFLLGLVSAAVAIQWNKDKAQQEQLEAIAEAQAEASAVNRANRTNANSYGWDFSGKQ